MVKYSFVAGSLRIADFFRFFLQFPRICRGEKLFKSSLSKFLGVDHQRVFLFASGRMALYSFLKVLDLKPDDEVIVPGYTCVVVTNAIKYTGAKAVYADIDPDTLNISADQILRAVTPRTKVIIVSHNFGIPFRGIQQIRRAHPDIYIVEDAAHAFGSEAAGEKVGLAGDISFFSLEYSKPLTTGIGGFIVVNNEKIRDSFQNYYQTLRYYPRIWRWKILITLMAHVFTTSRLILPLKGYIFRALQKFKLLFQTGDAEIRGDFPSHYPARLSPGFAFLGYLQMTRIQTIIAHKKALAGLYYKVFLDCPNIRQFYDPEAVYVRYPMIISDPEARRKVIARIQEATAMGVGTWFDNVVHPAGSFRYCYQDACCPVGERISQEIINLPISIHLPLEYIRRYKGELLDAVEKAHEA